MTKDIPLYIGVLWTTYSQLQSCWYRKEPMSMIQKLRLGKHHWYVHPWNLLPFKGIKITLTYYLCWYCSKILTLFPQHWAASQGHILIADLLLEHGANVHKVDKAGFTAVHFASTQGHSLFLHFLNLKGANLLSIDFEFHTPLHWAAYQVHTNTKSTE